MPRPLLTARWTNLAMLSYVVPRAMLSPFVPLGPRGVGLEIDAPPMPGVTPTDAALVSLVALEWRHTRAMGLPWPGHADFLEWQLRFYVRTTDPGGGTRARAASAGAGQRGVVIVRSYVQRPMIAWARRRFYNEPCTQANIRSRLSQDTRTIAAEYSIDTGGEAGPPGGPPPRPLTTHTIRIAARKPVTRPGPETLEHWLKEHRWVFGMFPQRGPNKPARGVVYEVIHPLWGSYGLDRADVAVDFAALFGADWGFLGAAAPRSAMLVAGSEVAVFSPRDQVGVRWGERVSVTRP